jgi:hypothetical protein
MSTPLTVIRAVVTASFFLGGTVAQDTLNQHKVVLDSSGRLLSWVQPQDQAYDRVVRLAWQFLLEKVPVEPNGLKTYYAYCCLDWVKNAGTAWPHNPAGFYAMLADSAAAYYAYSGDRRVVDLTRELLNYQILHGTTPATWLWGGVPYASSNHGDIEYRGAYEFQYDRRNLGRGDGYGVIEPDKAGELGVGYLKFYKLTGDPIYREAALACARALARNVRSGSEQQSPWPFRVYAETGIVREQYASNVIGPIHLLDEMGKMKLGEVDAFQRASDMAWSWMMRFPIANNVWANYFEDIPIMAQLTNFNQYAPGETARYLMDHPERDPEWRAHVKGLVAFIEKTFAVDDKEAKGWQWGANAISEQIGFMPKMGSHTSRYASVAARLAELTGDQEAREKAFRSFNWATYMCRENGAVYDIPRKGNDPIWFSDGYGDYIRHVIAGMAAFPEWAPEGQNHLLRSSSIVTEIAYEGARVRYRVFDAGAVDVLRLAFRPARVLASGKPLAERKDLDAEGWTYDPKLNVLRVRHTATDVDIAQ